MKVDHQRAETCSETKSVVAGIVAPTVIFEYIFVDFKSINFISACYDKANPYVRDKKSQDVRYEGNNSTRIWSCWLVLGTRCK